MSRQKIELLLPGDTDGRGYPGGIKQQFGAVRDMVEAILLQLKQLPDFQVCCTPAWKLHTHRSPERRSLWTCCMNSGGIRRLSFQQTLRCHSCKRSFQPALRGISCPAPAPAACAETLGPHSVLLQELHAVE